MLTDFKGADHVYIVCGYTDLRRGIDGLVSMVQQQFQMNPFSNTLFMFYGRRRDRIKGLYWNRQGHSFEPANNVQLVAMGSGASVDPGYDQLHGKILKRDVLHVDETTL